MVHWKNPVEMRIPVPYGFLAAKAWGESDSEPVLALHGWQNNAGTFDPLIPLLSSKLYIVAVDAPGHGFSSHKPIGAYYNYMSILVDIKRVVEFLKWEKFSIMGHSFGAALAMIYASLYPENIKNIVSLDMVKPNSRDVDLIPDLTRSSIDELLMMEAKLSKPLPVLSKKMALELLIGATDNGITADAANTLLVRGCRQSDCGKGVVFTRDSRLKVGDLQRMSHGDLKSLLRRMKCNLLIVLGTQPSIFSSATPEVIPEFLQLLQEVCNTCEVVKLDGNHFVHLNSPELVAPHVDNFFKLHYNKFSKF